MRHAPEDVENAVLEAQFDGWEVVQLARAAALLVGIALASGEAKAADEWGGSVAVSSDYFVRGISRTTDNPAAQVDLHYSSPGGFLAGAFASNTRIDPAEPSDLELSEFIGYAWNVNNDWRAKILASHYAYPGNHSGSRYDYDEIDADVAIQGWLHVSVGYSPNSPRFLVFPYRNLVEVAEMSAEMSAQRQIFDKFSVTAGAGYSFLGGPRSGGYLYWSAGAAYDFRSVTLALSYVNTSAEAKALFYNAAATGQWTATAIWRF